MEARKGDPKEVAHRFTEELIEMLISGMQDTYELGKARGGYR